jgi:hypothetical protein
MEIKKARIILAQFDDRLNKGIDEGKYRIKHGQTSWRMYCFQATRNFAAMYPTFPTCFFDCMTVACSHQRVSGRNSSVSTFKQDLLLFALMPYFRSLEKKEA